jgi:hypothetical protein
MEQDGLAVHAEIHAAAIHAAALSHETLALADLINGTTEVQVSIVATVTVPTVNGKWTQGDAVHAAAWAAREGRADYEAHEVGATGAPGPVIECSEADEATSWTPSAHRH